MRPCFRPLYSEKHRHRYRRPLSFLASLVLWVVLMCGSVQAELFDQYQVKAVFLYNLTNFITWPDHEGRDQNQPFTIAVIGRDNLGAYLDKSVANESIDGRQVVIKRYGDLDALQRRPCDLLFVSEDQLAIWPQIRAIARRHAILTVSDVEGFAHRGGMVNLVASGRKIRIEINIEAARRDGFEISAKLLKLARIVNSGKDD